MRWSGSPPFSTFAPLNARGATRSDGIAPDLALAVNSSAFNIGIAAAGWLGGAALVAGYSAAQPPFLCADALVLAFAVSLVLTARVKSRRRVADSSLSHPQSARAR
ncbi:hypothetical protein ABZZ04_23765 [Streptomyces sp. NPDC006435]|uniref:hypothetical protein n=1 Tax=Streptomyces sp. NPDC006435 TaxID=3154300 RepID=UPI0033A561BB